MAELTDVFNAVFSLQSILILCGGVLMGIIVGCLPGLSATLGVALVLPLTFTMKPLIGILMMVGVYCGAVYGGSISAILLGIPGTPAAVATVLDGQPMTKRGQAGLALGVATIASFTGGIISVILLALLSNPIGKLGLAFGEREFFALGLFALSAVALLGGSSFAKGMLSAAIGIFLASVGIDGVHGIPRFTFGSLNLMAGISYMPIMIGLFAIPETLLNISMISKVKPKVPKVNRVMPGLPLFGKLLGPLFRSLGIGFVVGAVPGTGADIAAIISYSQGKNLSKNSEQFGTGIPEGVVCSEAANNAACGGTMITLLTLGIPGGAVTAIIMGAFMIHGLNPGPLLMQQNSTLVYQIILGMAVAQVAMLTFGLLLAKGFSRISKVPQYYLNPIIILLCLSGSYALRNSFFDVVVMAAAGLFGYIMIKNDIPRAPMIIAMILSKLIETNLARSVMLVHGNFFGMFTPISTVLFILALLPFVLTFRNWYRERKILASQS